ncbi:MAG: DNA-processing protein DprA [Patescibacteria group bacterium]
MDQVQLLSEENFPPLLREIPDAPEKLYFRGTLPDWSEYKFLSVVGSRKFSDYGKEACRKIISELAGYSIIIVSGLALGIDSIAHRSALDAKLKTLAIPGSGLSDKVLYPASHLSLAKEILSNGGLLLSEFEPDFKATPYSFPQRNRIMAGISHATLVIEAEIKSGTLITSKLATDYNRDVFTVPGSIFQESSKGPLMLIRLGATPVASGKDVLEALHLKTEEKETTLLEDLSEEERKILELLTEPLEKNELIEILGLPLHETNSFLTALEIKGLIRESLGKVQKNI